MLALEIQDIRAFTSGLFIGDIFDAFGVHKVSITTFATFETDGRLVSDYLDTEALEKRSAQNADVVTWGEIRDYCRMLIRGKRPPVRFRIVLRFLPDDSPVSGALPWCFLNIQYRGGKLTCVTGSSLPDFGAGHPSSRAGEDYILNFFRQHQIAFRTAE